MYKDISSLIKLRLSLLAVSCGAVGYLMGPRGYLDFSFWHLCFFILGLSSTIFGSSALNQVQEVELDSKMPRTQGRPLPSGRMTLNVALGISSLFLAGGLFILSMMDTLLALLAFNTVILYNGFYTYIWKPRWAFGAVPGAIPGAMPVVLGYVASGGMPLTKECFYLFMILFLWQMPHFWSLALRFRQDYRSGHIPTLPTQVGVDRTLLHMGAYLFAYLAVALAAPVFTHAYVFYVLGVIPCALWIFVEFWRFSFAEAQSNQKWFRFFMSINASLLAFLLAPLIDKWILNL